MSDLESLDLSSLWRASPPLELRLAGDVTGKGRIAGLASAFGGPPDSYGDVIAAGAFGPSLAKHKAAGTAPPMLWSHDPKAPIGRWLQLREDASGLRVEGQINLETRNGREAYEHVKAGDVTGLSIGFRVPPGGRAFGKGHSILRQVDVVEISVVAIPANSRARITATKGVASRRDLEAVLHKHAGLSRAAAAKVAAGGWPALSELDDPVETFVERIKAASRELRGAK